MNMHRWASTAALIATLGLAVSASATPLVSQAHPYRGTLSKIGKAITYPVKKAAGNGSKVVNHGGKAVAYPVRKAGENTSKTTHKVVRKVVPRNKV